MTNLSNQSLVASNA